MPHAGFVHLRVHSAYSLLEGAIKIDDLVARCRRQAMPAVAVTDSGNLFGALEFALAAKASGVQPIIGCQLAITRADAQGHGGPLGGPAGRPDPDPIVLLVQDQAGYRNLMRLVSKAFLETPSGDSPQVAFADLEAMNAGLIALTGGPAGPVGRCLLEGQDAAAEAALGALARIFPGRLYVEIMRHGTAEEARIEDRLVDLAYAHDLPLVATNEVFFAEAEMYEAHDALLCIAEGSYVSEAERRRVTPEHRFKSAAEMIELFADLPEAVANTLAIARRCGFVPGAVDPILPAFPTEAGRNEAEELRARSEAGLEARLSERVYTPEMDGAARAEAARTYRERLEYELGVIVQMGYPGYFLIVADFIQWAKQQGIPVGPGRGSGAGSVVSWALTISDLDPSTAPVYTFVTEDGNGKDYLYVLNGRRSFKIDIGSQAVDETKDFGANAVCGRPALFKGTWYVPLGNSVDYVRLTTVAIPASTDTWTTVSGGTAAERKALHFTLLTKLTIAQICKALTNSQIAFSSDPTDPVGYGQAFDVGSNHTGIVDLHTWLGEIAIVKQDSVYRADSDGNSHPIQTFVGGTITPAYTFYGAGSFVHGKYFYWPHVSGLWRFIGDSATSIGYEAADDWQIAKQGEMTALERPPYWTSFAAYGRWAYATADKDLMYGWIRDDGTVRWHGALGRKSGGGNRQRVAVAEVGSPTLWFIDTGKITQIRIDTDGSTAGGLGDSRGDTSLTAYAQLAEVDFGDRTRTKQLRKFWVELENWDAQVTLSLKVFRDFGNSAETVGNTITSGTYIERYWTPGTNDLARTLTPYVKFVASGSYNEGSADPRIIAMGIEAATPTIYHIDMILTPGTVRDGSVASAHRRLRDVLGHDVTIKEPELGGAEDQWTGSIIGYTEDAIPGTKSERGWAVTLLVERYDYGS